MMDNFDITKWNRDRYITEANNGLNIEKIDRSYNKILELIEVEAKKLNDNDAFELHEKLKSWFNKLIEDKVKGKEEENKIGDNLYKAVTGENPKTSTKNKLRAPKNEIKVNTPPQIYVVGYWTYYNGDWDSDYVEVKAVSEEDAIKKAKDLAPRASKDFKAKLK